MEGKKPKNPVPTLLLTLRLYFPLWSLLTYSAISATTRPLLYTLKKGNPASVWNETGLVGKMNTSLRFFFLCLTLNINIVFLRQSFVWYVPDLKQIIWRHGFTYDVSNHHGLSVGLKVFDLLLIPLQQGGISGGTYRWSSCGPDLDKNGFKGRKIPIWGLCVITGNIQLKTLLRWHRLPLWHWITAGTWQGVGWDLSGKRAAIIMSRMSKLAFRVQLWEELKAWKETC